MMLTPFKNLSLCIMLLISGVVQAEVYRWTDENGKVHFGDRPPANVEAKSLDMPEAKSSGKPAMSNQQRKERQRRLVEALEEERRLKEQAKQEAKEKQAKKEADCRRLLAKVKDSERINRYYRYTKKGERTYMSDEEADRYRAELRSTYESQCQK